MFDTLFFVKLSQICSICSVEIDYVFPKKFNFNKMNTLNLNPKCYRPDCALKIFLQIEYQKAQKHLSNKEKICHKMLSLKIYSINRKSFPQAWKKNFLSNCFSAKRFFLKYKKYTKAFYNAKHFNSLEKNSHNVFIANFIFNYKQISCCL